MKQMPTTPNPKAPSPFQSGDLIGGKYQIENVVGSGGMAVVYKAIQVSLNRPVAIKVLHPELARDTGFIDRFEAEAAILANLSHPNIIKIFDKGVEQKCFYIVTEFVDGRDLDELIMSKQVLVDDWARIIMESCDALSYIHRSGIIHRDVKASNIMIDRHDLIRLGDFGISQFFSPRRSLQAAQSDSPSFDGMGTRDYMAPEMLDASAIIDHRADIFSLGVVFYKMMTRRFPGKQYRPPSEITQYANPNIDEVLARAMATNPDDRFDTVEDFKLSLIEALGTRLRTMGIPPDQGSSSPQIRTPTRYPSSALSDALAPPVQKGKKPPARNSATMAPPVKMAIMCGAGILLIGFLVGMGYLIVGRLNNSTPQRIAQSEPAAPSPSPTIAPVAVRSSVPFPGTGSVAEAIQQPPSSDFAIYSYTIKLPPGRYEYKFLSEDGQWFVDSLNPERSLSNLQSENSVFSIPGGAYFPDGRRAPWPKVDDKSGEVTFRFETDQELSNLEVRGDFNNWADDSGHWMKRISNQTAMSSPYLQSEPTPVPTSRPRITPPPKSVSPFEAIAPMPIGRGFHGSAVIGDFLYIIGGRRGDAVNTQIEHDETTVWCGKIQSDGNIGVWSDAAIIPAPRYYIANSTVVVEDTIYVIGGSDAVIGGKSYNTVIFSKQRPDGSLTPWQTSSPFGEDLSSPAAVATRGCIHIIGGQTSGDHISGKVWSNTIKPDGTLGTWKESPSLPVGLWFHQAGVVRDRIYVWGGLESGNFETPVPSARVYSSPVDSVGLPGEWRQESVKLEVPFYSASAAVAGDYLISFCPRYAGRELSNDVWWSKIDSRGLTAWKKLSTTVHQRVYHAAAPDYARDSIYLSGGRLEAGGPLANNLVLFRLAGK